MRKIVIVSATVLIILAGVTFQAFCEGLKAIGTVDQINIKFATFVIYAEEGSWKVFATDSKTIITKNGKKIKLEDIKKDDFVSVVYEAMRTGTSSKDIAKTVIVKEKKEFSKEAKNKR